MQKYLSTKLVSEFKTRLNDINNLSSAINSFWNSEEISHHDIAKSLQRIKERNIFEIIDFILGEEQCKK